MHNQPNNPKAPKNTAKSPKPNPAQFLFPKPATGFKGSVLVLLSSIGWSKFAGTSFAGTSLGLAGARASGAGSFRLSGKP